MAPISVLVADDQPVYRAGLLTTLNAEPDITVVGEAIDGPDLLRKATELRPQVILMEILMMSGGFDLATKIQTELPDLKVVILTNSRREGDIFEAIASGCHGYLRKTSSHAEIIQAVRMAAGGEIMLSNGIAANLVKKLRSRSTGPKLSTRELEVLKLISEGQTDTQISNSLSLSVSTIRTYVRRIIEKCGVKNRAGAATLYAREYHASFDRVAQGIREMNIVSELERDRTSLERSLEDSEERYRRHFENIADVLVCFDEQLRILDISPSVEKVLGYAPNELVGRTIPESGMLTKESLERMLSNFRKFLLGEGTYPMVYDFIHKDGSRRWGEVRSAPIIEAGRETMYVAVIRDVTDRISAEQSLRESEAKFRAIFNSVDEYIYVYDKEGICVDVNCHHRLSGLGHTYEELIGSRLSLFDPVLKGPESSLDDWHRRHLEKVEPEPPVIFQGTHCDGGERYFEVTTSVLREGEKAIGTVSIVRDITDRGDMEPRLAKANVDLRAKNRRLEDMVGELVMARAFKRELLETLKDGILALDMEGFIIHVNTAFLEMVECTREQCIGMPVSEMAGTMLSQSSAEAAINLVKKVLSSKKLPAQKVPITMKGGRHKLLSMTGDLAFDDRGKPKMVIASFRDITDDQQIPQ